MPPRRRGIAAVKKAPSKYLVVYSDTETEAETGSSGREDDRPPQPRTTPAKTNLSVPQRGQCQATNSNSAGQSTLAPTLLRNDHNINRRINYNNNYNINHTNNDDHIALPDTIEFVEDLSNYKPRFPDQHSSRTNSPPINSTRTLDFTLQRSSRSLKSTTNRPLARLPGVEMAGNYIPTSQARHMRACMVCSIVRTYTQFMQSGCPNCDGFLELTGNSDAIQDCTSQVFDGLLTVSNTTKSWVARYQRLEGYVPGVYAIQVEGILPEDAVVAAEQAGVHYIPRDGSVSEALPNEG